MRAAVTRALAAATGVTPRTGGDVRLTMLPPSSVRLHELRFDDGERPGLSAGAVQAPVQLLPLLVGSIEIGSITFVGPHLAIEVRGDRAFVLGLPLKPPAEEAELA